MLRYAYAIVMVFVTISAGSTAEAGEHSMRLKSAYNLTWIKSHSRPCEPADLPGIWRLLTYDSPRRFKNPHAPYLQPHQLFQFTSNGGMRSVHSSIPIRDNPVQVFQGSPSDMAYSLEPHGLLLVQAHGTAETKESWQCVAIMHDRYDGQRHPAMKRGDILMKLIGTRGQILFVRQLRKEPA